MATEDIRCVEEGYLVCGTAGCSPSSRLSVQMRGLNYQWLVHRVKVWLASAVTVEQPWWSKELQHASVINPSTLSSVYVEVQTALMDLLQASLMEAQQIFLISSKTVQNH